MGKVLFIPLNTNHVSIFYNVIKEMKCPYNVLCHDKIAGDKKYHTEQALQAINIPYSHFPRHLPRTEHENVFLQLKNYFSMKNLIKEVLDSLRPDVIVLAIDNDPISNLFLKTAQGKHIKTVVLQEGSARPDASVAINGLEGYLKEGLRRLFGIQLSYILHGTSNLFDQYFVSGRSSREILINRGVPSSKIKITGSPKYDPFMARADDLRPKRKESRLLVYAAGFSVIANEPHLKLLRDLIDSTKKLGLSLIVKLHPRSSVTPQEVKDSLTGIDLTHCSIIKEGDETIDLLSKAYGLITISSTVVTEALIIDREGILANYLADENRLPFDGFNAVHKIENPENIHQVLTDSIEHKKSFENKEKLLETIFYKLDSNAGERAAKRIEKLCCSNS